MDMNNIASKILQENRKWFDASKELPKPGQKVVIRMCDPSMELGKTEAGKIIAVEDMKIGVYIDNKWMVAPPYPKFDYSPLSSGPFINDGAIVTHWAIPEEGVDGDIGEVEAWETRFSLAGEYKTLSVKIDEKYEELLYRACSLGAACIRKIYGEDKDTLPMIAVLWDIQAIMDQDAEIRDGELIKIDNELQNAIDTINKAKDMLKDGDDEEIDKGNKSTLRDMFLLGIFGDKPVRINRITNPNKPKGTPYFGRIITEGENLQTVLNENPKLGEAIYHGCDDTSPDGYVFIDVFIPEEVE